MSVGGIRSRPPHLDEQDRLGFTLIRTDKGDVGGERKVSYGVNSCAMVWIRGAVVYLWVAGHAEKKADVDADGIAVANHPSLRFASVGQFDVEQIDADYLARVLALRCERLFS